jgi:23S rRNA (uracil1939-C5)-methyltransferase
MRKKKVIVTPDRPIQVHSLSHEGRGIAAVDGKTTFVEGALPDEIVKYRLFKKHRHYDEAACCEILTASPQRTTPHCSQFGVCGGCSMQHLATAAQIDWKQKILIEQLQQLGQVKPESILAPLAAAPWGYRHKARLGVRYLDKYQKAVVGFRQKFRHQIADVEHCPVLHPSVGTRLPALSDLISSLDCKEQLPQIEVAIGDDQAALIFRHLIALTPSDLTKFLAFGKEQQLHIYLQPNPPEPLTLLWPDNSPQRLAYRLPDYQLEFLFHPTDFTQIHLEMNRLMVKQAVTLLDPQPQETVLDLFCGIGNFSLPLARVAGKVIGIEGSQLMVERATENAQHNNLKNVAFYAENLFAPGNGKWLQESYAKILLDPPRTGAQEIIDYFPQLAPQRIVYVSCNPATLARDAKLLVHRYGYRLEQAGIMNMFPHTSHVEAMAVFTV